MPTPFKATRVGADRRPSLRLRDVTILPAVLA